MVLSVGSTNGFILGSARESDVHLIQFRTCSGESIVVGLYAGVEDVGEQPAGGNIKPGSGVRIVWSPPESLVIGLLTVPESSLKSVIGARTGRALL